MAEIGELRKKLYEALDKGCKHEIHSIIQELHAEILRIVNGGCRQKGLMTG